MEALREATAELTVYVHPSNAGDVRRAVARQLSTLLFSYEDRFDGVLLSHEAEFEGDNEDDQHRKVDQDGEKVIKAKILDGLVPYFGVPVTANLLLFSPQPEMILEGEVEMLGKESIHAIILGVFSAAIMSDDIPETFKFKRRGHGGKFVSQLDKRHVIKKGSMIRFYVKRVDTEMNCHITGSLMPPHTGCMRWLSVHDAEYASEISSGKRKPRDHTKGEQNVQDRATANREDSVVNSERPRKSRKRNVEE